VLQGGFLDEVPIGLTWLLTGVLALLAAEIGYRLGIRWRRGHASEKAETGGAMAGAALALLAFYLAFMVSFTVQRLDGRREMIMDEANAIGTTYLRAGYLPDATGSEVRRILREYTAERLRLPQAELRTAALARSNELMGELWTLTEAQVEAGPDTPSTALFVTTVNETIDLGSKRQVAILTWRAPWTMWVATFIMAFGAMGLLGFAGGLQESRNPIALVVLILVFSLVINLIIDLDRPYEGLLTVSQEPLIELQDQIGDP
jgi:hypothetical protein